MGFTHQEMVLYYWDLEDGFSLKKLKWFLPIKRWFFDIGIWKEDGIMEGTIFWKRWLKKLERDLGYGVLIHVVWK